MLRTDGAREVNGAATDASPGRTIGSPASASPSMSEAALAPSYTLPCSALSRRRSATSSSCMRFIVTW